MVVTSVFRVLLSVLAGDLQYQDPIVSAVYSSIENPSSPTRWGDLSERLEGLQIANIKEAPEGTIAFGQNQLGELVLFVWLRKPRAGSPSVDSVTEQVFETDLASADTPEKYRAWSAERAAVRGKILAAKGQDASVLALQFSFDDVQEIEASPKTLVSEKPIALIFP